MERKKGIAILGSTGSIGSQALEVLEQYPNRFDLQVITANRNAELLIAQAKKYQPNTVVIADEDQFQQVRDALWDEDIHVYAGSDSLCQVVSGSEIHTVLTAIVGYSGLKPTIAAIEAKKTVALANKETLVVAGELIKDLAMKNNVAIYPVDSEHSAIFQCLTGEFQNPIEKVYLTASGGPFRGYSSSQLENVTKVQAMKHPNWSMGAKITVDCATMMNKGLEVIEAKWLFDLRPAQVDVIVHPQSIVHSLVQFEDGSIKAQLGLPDMKLPIQYALTYPERFPTKFDRFNFLEYPELTFEQPDLQTFRNLQLAFDAIHVGGTMPCALNAANEVAVQAFLEDKIRFLQIAEINEKTMHHTHTKGVSELDEYMAIDTEARSYARSLIR